MSVKSFLVVLMLGVVPLGGMAARAEAQTVPYLHHNERAFQPIRQVRPRIEVSPGRLLYRRRVDWYELQHRPSGTVLFPQMRCWWVRG
jgi:hypothetical protein